ncbi:C-C motif chemokine 20b [Thunnus albacares]|uniref:C-C motif chemokine 20b n=1 Tax=Thunnus albacares TaxID=8236 RepID=UPI001CF6C064|nr:C-C motif chemokine 20b [Thunnus albacares]
MASGKTYLVAALCSFIIISTFVSSTQSASCCLSYSRRRLQCKQLSGYTIQTINTSCDINAIIFHPRRKFVCADPSMNRTLMMMKCVDDKRKTITQVIREKIKARTPSA